MAISQNTAGQLGSHRQNRNCLPEIATSACGLLAMTNLGVLRRRIHAAHAARLHGAQGASLQAPPGAFAFNGSLCESAAVCRGAFSLI